MDNAWAHTENYPGYLVSPNGSVMHERLERIITPRFNNWNTLVVKLRHPSGRGFTTVPVARLVGEAYVAKHEPIGTRQYLPDVLIHKNLDRSDCTADNLEWRYRFYGIQYHQLANNPGWGNPYLKESECPWRNWIIHESSFDEYGTIAHFASTYGLIPVTLFRAVVNNYASGTFFGASSAFPEQIYTLALLKVIASAPLSFSVHEKKLV